MPLYSFENTETGEEFDMQMKMAELDTFLAENKNVRQIFTQLNIGDSVRLGITKPPSDFSKYVLGRVKETNPLGTAIERRHTITKEV
jgi:hypothetical protein